MTRKSKREIERALEDLNDSPDTGVATVTFREWRGDEDGDPVECVHETEHDIETSASQDIVINDIVVPTDWERDQ
ncbi:hypothetical protein [Haloarcula salina]|uniref:Uncharacterized protein n=1 Tax=Haloarcula salina TaxID=1429914 RepID=A0AA41FWU5_9EURY|nr:hypothetical protein [Haloarcula salina]MBV0900163.1 hypothetical protein [Haloarcula salina]